MAPQNETGSKSIFDSVPVDNKAFPLRPTLAELPNDEEDKEEDYIIVGHCPHCQAPIYGPTLVAPGDGPVSIRRSCGCVGTLNAPTVSNYQQKDIRDTMRTT